MRDERRFIGVPLWAWGCIRTAASAVEVPSSLPHASCMVRFHFFLFLDFRLCCCGRVARGLFAWRGLKSGLWDVSR
jgi:hypothetical protein